MHENILKLVAANPKDTAKVLALKIYSNWIAKRTRDPSERSVDSCCLHHFFFLFASSVFFSVRLLTLLFHCCFVCLFVCLCFARSDPASVPQSVLDFLVRSLQSLSDSASSEVENVALAYVMLLHNVVCWFGRLKIKQSELYPLIAAGIVELLSHQRNSKIQFYALLTMGSIVRAHTHTRTHTHTAAAARGMQAVTVCRWNAHVSLIRLWCFAQAYASTSARDLLRSHFSQPFIAFIDGATRSDNAALQQVARDCKLLYQI